MPDLKDAILVDQEKTRRRRLGAALIYGEQKERRTVNDNMKRVIGSVVAAAVASAICVGISFTISILNQRAEEQAARDNPAPVVTVVPEDTP